MLNILAFLMQSDNSGNPVAGAFGATFMVIWLVLVVVMIAALWKLFDKAGEPGWAAIIPIYNIIVLLKVAGRPVWWILLFLIPLVNLIVGVIVVVDVAKRFGKGVGFAIGMIVLPFIFYPLLAWGDAQYQAAAPATA